ncbi:extracellular solute-binding protein [Candidatus Halobonum tyrrellensis]|uniref:extracellular solute-binding protein n=1 Tax=Candidatus Halobonum tyrrellensis TaxID=1431545 RepID=UPI0006775D4C|nr:extracellular solute-binding protein [Candidatus Halobonum tyrrellensis]
MGRDTNSRGRVGRRSYLRAVGAGATAAGLAGCVGNLTGGGSGEPGGQVDDTANPTGSYEGVELNFATSSNYIDAWNDLASQFSEQSGIEVEVTSYAQSEMLTQLLNQFRAQEASFDAFISDVIWTGSFMQPGFAEDLGPYFDSPLANADYDYDDHLTVFAENYGQWNGTRYGLPWYGDVMKLSVRKDVLEEHADAYESEHDESIMPEMFGGYESYAKYNRVAQFMHDQGWDMGLEGQRGWNIVYYYPNRFAAETGEASMLDDDGNSRLDAEGATTALQHYIDQVEWARNPLSTGYTQSRDQFLDGNTWAVEQWGTATAQFIDEWGWEEGVRVSLTPGGYPNLGGWGVLLNTYSNQEVKDAAFLFAQWATSKEMDKYAFTEHGVTPTRRSSFTDEIKEEYPQARYQDPEENPGIEQLSLRPRNPSYQELGDTMQVQISDALSGNTGAAETMQSIHDEWESIMSENE